MTSQKIDFGLEKENHLERKCSVNFFGSRNNYQIFPVLQKQNRLVVYQGEALNVLIAF